MIVIGIGNKARHGKDTAASAILTHASRSLFPTLKISWADALRKEANEAIANAGSVEKLLREGIEHLFPGFGYEHIAFPEWVKPSPDAKLTPENPFGKHSLLLQWWGTEYRRAQDPDYWVKRVNEAIAQFKKQNPNGVVVIPDTRFLNEAAAIINLGGSTLNITRLNDDGTLFYDPGRDKYHRSETELDSFNWDYRIYTKSAALTGELAITIFEYIRGLRGL